MMVKYVSLAQGHMAYGLELLTTMLSYSVEKAWKQHRKHQVNIPEHRPK